MHGEVMRVGAPTYQSGHPAGGRVDQVVDIPGVVALEDPDRDTFI